MSLVNYKGYAARIEFDAEDEIFFGHIAGIKDIIGFHADTVRDLLTAFHASVDDYIAVCAKIGKDPQKPYSGKIMIRVDPQVHASAAIAADLAGKSLNKWTEEKLREAAESDLRSKI